MQSVFTCSSSEHEIVRLDCKPLRPVHGTTHLSTGAEAVEWGLPHICYTANSVAAQYCVFASFTWRTCSLLHCGDTTEAYGASILIQVMFVNSCVKLGQTLLHRICRHSGRWHLKTSVHIVKHKLDLFWQPCFVAFQCKKTINSGFVATHVPTHMGAPCLLQRTSSQKRLVLSMEWKKKKFL